VVREREVLDQQEGRTRIVVVRPPDDKLREAGDVLPVKEAPGHEEIVQGFFQEGLGPLPDLADG